MNTLTNFLSNKTNLTILQCVLYFILGYIIHDHFTGTQFFIMFITICIINFIVHIKSVSKGMMMREMMEEERHHMIEFIKELEEESKKEKKD